MWGIDNCSMFKTKYVVKSEILDEIKHFHPNQWSVIYLLSNSDVILSPERNRTASLMMIHQLNIYAIDFPAQFTNLNFLFNQVKQKSGLQKFLFGSFSGSVAHTTLWGIVLVGDPRLTMDIFWKITQQYQWIDLPEPLQQRNYGFLKL